MASLDHSDTGHAAQIDLQAGAAVGTTITQDAPAGPTGQQPAPALEVSPGNRTQLEEILPEIKNLALKVGGMKNLAAIIANLQ